MTPKFAVGEVVIIQSSVIDKFNGQEHVVVSINPPNSPTVCEAGTRVVFYGPNYAYNLGFSVEYEGGVTSYWDESSLRKKHQPGELSFDKLMSSLSQPVQEPSHS